VIFGNNLSYLILALKTAINGFSFLKSSNFLELEVSFFPLLSVFPPKGLLVEAESVFPLDNILFKGFSTFALLSFPKSF
jgi:hypothetical protein